MSTAAPDPVDIAATIARGEWWVRLFDELSSLGVGRCRQLARPGEAPSRGLIQTFCRAARAVRMAVVAAMRLDQILSRLDDLRKHAAADIAAVRARAMAKAKEDAAREQAREQVREETKAIREARTPEIPERVIDRVESADIAESPVREPRDRDPLVEALDKRLTAVDPLLVDFDDLQLRETVLRICADLGVTPDWNRWEAGDWSTPDTALAATVPVSTAPSKPADSAPKLRPPGAVRDTADLAARAAKAARSCLRLAEMDPSNRRPPKLE